VDDAAFGRSRTRAKLVQGTVCKILGQEEIKPHKVRYYLERRDAEFEQKMAEVLCVYREVQVLKKAVAKSRKSIKRVAIVSYDEKPGIQASLGGPHLDDLTDHAGWNRVEVSLNFDVVIRRHAGATPFGILIGLGRQRHQGRTIDGVEELAAAGTELAHQAGIEVVDQDADRDVQLGEREEAPIAQPR
jgi:hypothetical protein